MAISNGDITEDGDKESMCAFGFNPGYICSIPGLLRILNIGVGIVAFGLWLPGYPDQFSGTKINQNSGDTESGYGYGWQREPLNQFVLAAIIISLLGSILFLLALIFVKRAAVNWNRLNKFIHLELALLLFAAGVCAIQGAWYFTQDCCHVSMHWRGGILAFDVTTTTGDGDEYYIRHCICYLTRYSQNGNAETVEYDATRAQDLSGLDYRWTFAAHDMDPHLADIFFIFVNSLLYFAATIFSKARK